MARTRRGSAIVALLARRRPDPAAPAETGELVKALDEMRRKIDELAHDLAEARSQAETDALTGLYNHRYFHETLRREVTRAQRYGRNLALIVLDLDNFKTVNDRTGHLAGDRALAQAAARLGDVVRSVDVPCRVGGDEFAVILPESSAADADQLYRRVHDALQATSAGPKGNQLRISAGIAELEHADTAAGLFERADRALYRAKELGKSRVDVSRSAGPQ